jgi:hypothetical protein
MLVPPQSLQVYLWRLADMLADAGAPAVLASAPLEVILADAGAPAVLAGARDVVVLADAVAPVVLAPAPAAVMLADAGAPAVLAPAPLVVMLADAGAPAVLALAPAAVMLADAGAPAVLDDQMTFICSCTCSFGGHARTSCAPSAVRSTSAFASPFPPHPPPPPAPPHRRPAAPQCCCQPAPRGTRGTCPAAPNPRSPPPASLAPPPLAAAGVTAPLKRVAGCALCGHLGVLPPGSAQAGWKGPKAHWAQQRAGVRPTDSPHTGQARARSSSAALRGRAPRTRAWLSEARAWLDNR